MDQAQASYVGESPGDGAGYLSVVGDLNGDGIDDLLIGAIGYSWLAPQGGKVYVVYGRDSGWSLDMPLEAVPSVVGTATHQQLYVTHALGDVNGDGLADVGIMEYGGDTVDEYVMFGSLDPWPVDLPVDDADVILRASDGDPYEQPGLGDFDGDGLDDVLVTIDEIDGGSAHVLSGASLDGAVDFPTESDPLWVHADELGAYPFGIYYSALGDFTGDGLADVGAIDEGGTSYVLAGSKTPITDENIADVAAVTITNLTGTGAYAQSLGDVNGDGYGDLGVVSYDEGGIAIFFGGPGNEGMVRFDQAKLIITPSHASSRAMDVGDVNGDGLHDLAFWVYGATSSGTHDIAVVFGRKEWPATIALEEVDVLIPNQKGAYNMELEATMRGDLDGDGMNELVLVSNHEAWDKDAEAGVVRIFRGRTKWPSTFDRDDYDLGFHGSEQLQGVGSWSRLVITDINGDGMDDIVSSSYVHPADGTGTTFVFFGQPAP